MTSITQSEDTATPGVSTGSSATCPECGGLVKVARNGDWKCLAYDKIGFMNVLVCDARGTTVGSDLVVTRGSLGAWRSLITTEEVAREGSSTDSHGNDHHITKHADG